ncbi:hypothetical protein YPC_3057 [Yersinia pestis biovar Medievalis str. Harbin 35]|nr:hypothetical protein YPC_3057 [Yersinia pestis biovar Medievalis str. Harbin 35]EEO77713.1 hypothetical protein YP516_1393 [Yersinia pestis Nepal516]EEO80031.1 hypothetical protein YPF_3463 [Yersinia pestis biovar Orientalis str. India 195]EEO84860.1 hypothetical protein YPH_0685 [Yersinia pestis biovar Orientalis str. PEXU2]EEO89933.1 hypothetical protein YPS_2935 [Yersinia pestis Pestoides A]EIS75165.1 hypothetical protein YPPY71_3102 [Yersinia pestis PY-71]EIT39686.1 hypothetical protei
MLMDIFCHVWRIPKIPFLLDITVVRARITDFETRLFAALLQRQ